MPESRTHQAKVMLPTPMRSVRPRIPIVFKKSSPASPPRQLAKTAQDHSRRIRTLSSLSVPPRRNESVARLGGVGFGKSLACRSKIQINRPAGPRTPQGIHCQPGWPPLTIDVVCSNVRLSWPRREPKPMRDAARPKTRPGAKYSMHKATACWPTIDAHRAGNQFEHEPREFFNLRTPGADSAFLGQGPPRDQTKREEK